MLKNTQPQMVKFIELFNCLFPRLERRGLHYMGNEQPSSHYIFLPAASNAGS